MKFNTPSYFDQVLESKNHFVLASDHGKMQ